MVIANTWFTRRRTLAMSMITASVSVGGFLFTPLLAAAVVHWGWRPAAFGNGVAFLLLGLPMALLVRRSPESMGLQPDGDRVEAIPVMKRAEYSKSSAQQSFSLSEAMHTSSFWFLTVGTTLRVIVLTAVTVHYIPILVWKGLSQTEAAFLLGVQAFLGIPITLSFGWLADRVNKPRLMAVCMLFAMLSLVFLIFAQKEWHIRFFLPLYSLVESTFPVNWSTVGEYFGRANFAKIRGSMIFIQAWGAVVGPVIAGVIYDRTQSYSYLLWGLVGVLFTVSCLYAMVVKPSRFRAT